MCLYYLIKHAYIYIYNICVCVFSSVGLMSRVFANGPGDQSSIQGQVIPKTFFKNGTWYLLA